MTDDELHETIADYHKFIALFAAYPADGIGPTLAIDILWHSHQVMHCY